MVIKPKLKNLRRVSKPRKADVYKYSNVKIPHTKNSQQLGIDQVMEQNAYIHKVLCFIRMKYVTFKKPHTYIYIFLQNIKMKLLPLLHQKQYPYFCAIIDPTYIHFPLLQIYRPSIYNCTMLCT